MKYLIFAFSFLFIYACNSSSAPTSVPVNLDGFEAESVPGSEHKRVFRKGPSGVVMEEGTILNGKRNGQWIEYHSSNAEGRIKSITHYINDKKTGAQLQFNTRGQIEVKANFMNDQYHGKVAKYQFGRPLEETEYKNGQYHGFHKTYYQRGDVQQEVEYKNGKQDGKFRYYDEDGNITLEYTYKNGEKVSGGIVDKE